MTGIQNMSLNNTTSINGTYTSPHDCFQCADQIPAIIAPSCLSVALHILNLVVFKRCRKFPVQVKILIYNLLIQGILTNVGILAFVALSLVITVPIFIFLEMISLSVLLDMCLIISLPLDRLLSLLLTFRYQTKISKPKILIYCIFVWMFSIGMTLSCIWFRGSLWANFFQSFLRLTLLLVFIGVNFKIFLVVKKINQQVIPLHHQATSHGDPTSTYKNIKITMPHVVLYISFITFDFLNMAGVMGFKFSLVVILISVSGVINSIFVIWRFTECRLQVRLLFSCCRSEAYKLDLEREKMEYYGIMSMSAVGQHDMFVQQTTRSSVKHSKEETSGGKSNQERCVKKSRQERCRHLSTISDTLLHLRSISPSLCLRYKLQNDETSVSADSVDRLNIVGKRKQNCQSI